MVPKLALLISLLIFSVLNFILILRCVEFLHTLGVITAFLEVVYSDLKYQVLESDIFESKNSYAIRV